MWRTGWMPALAAAALAGCAPRPAPVPAPAPAPAAPVETIRYEAGPCFGACPVYAITISSDGKGVFKGIRFTAVTGERAFTATPEQYAAFAGALAPWRPASGDVAYRPGEPNCRQAPTDLPSVDVAWEGKGARQHLYYYYGCSGPANEAMADALGNAPDSLPLAELIGERP